jgi:hypothetical protein
MGLVRVVKVVRKFYQVQLQNYVHVSCNDFLLLSMCPIFWSASWYYFQNKHLVNFEWNAHFEWDNIDEAWSISSCNSIACAVFSISLPRMQLSFNRTLSKIKNFVRKPMHRCTFLRRISRPCTEYLSAHHVARSSDKPWFTLFRGMGPSLRIQT